MKTTEINFYLLIWHGRIDRSHFRICQGGECLRAFAGILIPVFTPTYAQKLCGVKTAYAFFAE